MTQALPELISGASFAAVKFGEALAYPSQKLDLLGDVGQGGLFWKSIKELLDDLLIAHVASLLLPRRLTSLGLTNRIKR